MFLSNVFYSEIVHDKGERDGSPFVAPSMGGRVGEDTMITSHHQYSGRGVVADKKNVIRLLTL
jgi:hypothetical protein